MFLIVLIVAVVVFGYTGWMIEVDKCKNIVVDIAKQVARSKGVEVIYIGTISENKMKNISIVDRILKPGFTFEIRNKRKASTPGKISVLNDMERKMYLDYLRNELKADRRIRRFNFDARIADDGGSTQRCQVVVWPRNFGYNKKERTISLK